VTRQPLWNSTQAAGVAGGLLQMVSRPLLHFGVRPYKQSRKHLDFPVEHRRITRNSRGLEQPGGSFLGQFVWHRGLPIRFCRVASPSPCVVSSEFESSRLSPRAKIASLPKCLHVRRQVSRFRQDFHCLFFCYELPIPSTNRRNTDKPSATGQNRRSGSRVTEL
jgi:hypothetical protein